MTTLIDAGEATARKPRRRLSSLATRDVSAWTLLSAITFAVVIYLSSGPIDDPDVWWHVRLGHLILRTHHIPTHETWSYAALGHSWTPTAWLSDIAYAGVTNLGGYRALIVVKLVVCAIAALLVLRLVRRTRVSPPAAAIAFALTMLPLTFFLRERPQAFSLLFVAWLAGVCERVRRGEAVRVVPFLAMQWLWANVHGMWFLGPAFLVVACFGDLADSRRAALPRLRRNLLAAAGAVAVAAATPVGPRLVLQPLRVHSAAQGISEWMPTVLWDHSLAPYLLSLTILALALARRSRPVSWAEAIWIVTVVGFSLVAARNVAPAFILLAAPLARAADDLLHLPADIRIPVLMPAVVVATGTAFAVAGSATETAIASDQPTRLVHELGALPGPRHVLNGYDVGGLITGTQPAASVAIDGRTDNYPTTYFRRYIAALNLAGDWQQVIASLKPDCAILQSTTGLPHVLVAEYHWRVVDREAGYILLERGPHGVTTLPSSG